MKDSFAFHLAVHQACLRDTRYAREAYRFLCDALDHTVKMLGRAESGSRHVTGQELLAGWRDLAVMQFGPMATWVMGEWGIHRSEDVGAMVYNLIVLRYFGKNESDSIDDFSDGVDMEEALSKPFQSQRKGN
ncbi:MAG: Minf_1886 family protein [Roseimicrobium sp.]